MICTMCSVGFLHPVLIYTYLFLAYTGECTIVLQPYRSMCIMHWVYPNPTNSE